jgi:Putative peptidoglycan binding domain.
MIHSVGEYVAGTEVELPDEVADRFVVLGYAEGELSREFTDEEREALRANRQEVSV